MRGSCLILQEMGEIDEAIRCFRRAIALAPERTRYYQCLTRLTKLEADDPVFITLRELVKNETVSLSDHEMADIHFSLGKALSDISEHRLSFEHILKGNAIRRRHIAYDENRIFSGMRKTRELFSAEEVRKQMPGGSPSSRPIFIVGMPRSGSTLVEQILSSHPDVYAAGEVNTLRDTFRDAAARFPAWKTVAPLAYLTEDQRRSVAEDYLDRLDRLVVGWDGAGGPQRISNKTLGNYLYIGLIRQLWPNAHIIHTFRDPIDTCLSCFSISFNDLDFTFDLGELGRRYRHYQELMDHWRHVLPEGAMLDVRYEDTVDDLEATARRIISYCGLQWDDACLSFYKSRRPVRTSSVAQVRSPIYRSSVGRWRPDGETLRPLLEGLGFSG
ncbi:sulfotransferase [Komagataeibacter kakiaceti]|uniref:sulfotransferase n=1 Tax=Komagataeibacter kakiaceti TaxID=943261 RepID=UPI000B17FA13|nr:sulfotransferase [Komagataeibacter kakiaceti]